MTECEHQKLRRWSAGTWGCVEPRCGFVLRTAFDEPDTGCLHEGLGPKQLAIYRPGPDSKMLQDQEHGRFVFLKAVLELDNPCPVPDVLKRLAEAVDHLLTTHSCDGHGHEEYRRAQLRGKEILANWGWAERDNVDRVRVDDAITAKIAQNAYWKDDPLIVTLQPDDVAVIMIAPQEEPMSPPPSTGVVIDLTMKNDFLSCNGCDTPSVCKIKGCGREMRERLSAYPPCTCATNTKTCLRHNSFVDNTPKQIGA